MEATEKKKDELRMMIEQADKNNGTELLDDSKAEDSSMVAMMPADANKSDQVVLKTIETPLSQIGSSRNQGFMSSLMRGL